MMDWDNTRIVFTKRSLIEFLRCVCRYVWRLLLLREASLYSYTGTTVDTNFSNIQKLPSTFSRGVTSHVRTDF